VASYLNTKNTVTPALAGLIQRMDSFLGKLVASNGSASGSFKTSLDTITSQNKSLDAQMADIDRQLAMQRSSMEASFIAMERSQSKYQQQSAYISKTFSGNSGN
jgi:flagellar capping protein FliD